MILVRDGTGKSGKLWVIKSGRKKMLRGVMGLHEIVDRPGWHYEEALSAVTRTARPSMRR